MSQEQNQLFKEFEKEMWLYLDGDLSTDRMEYWNVKIDEHPQLLKYLEEYSHLEKLYSNINQVELREDKFNSMIDTAIKQNSLISKVRVYFSNLFNVDSELAFGKIAFTSVLIIGAVVISIISDRPNPVMNLTETINAEILEWDADFVDDQISKVGDLLKVAQDEDYRKYYKYKINTSTNVDKNINLINTNIQSLKEELNSKEL